MSILVVDDNPINLTIIEKILNSEGYTDIKLLHSAYELFDYLQIDAPHKIHRSVDLILLDLMMPEIDGIEACRRIQQDDELKHIPIIFVTAMGDSFKMAEALNVGANDYVMKPINKIELMARIRVALRLKHESDWHRERDKVIQSELQLAKQVQRSVLSHPVHNERIQISAAYLPTFELAGDMYSWIPIDEKRYGVILLDMMGHGIAASLVCMYISSVLRDTITKITDPEQVIQELNRYMYQLNSTERFLQYYFTAIYLVIDTEKRTVEYVNAGHPKGIMIVDDMSVHYLDKGSCAVGFFSEIEVQKTVIAYEKSMQMVLYTDGLLEMLENTVDDGTEIMKTALFNHPLTPEQLVENILPPEAREHQHDDMCLLMIRANE